MPEETIQPEAKSTETKQGSATDILHFEKWLATLGERKATDLHLIAGNVPMIRIDSNIVPLTEENILTVEMVQSIIEHLFSDAEQKQFIKCRNYLKSATLKKIMRFRVHAFYSRGFPGISLRHLPSESKTLAELGMPEIVKEFYSAEQGLYIVAGPFDSGRTTTVKSIISEINHTQSKYIVMLEHPIEYIIPSDKSVIVQREIGRDVESITKGIESIRDEDVDIVVVSSLDDAQTVDEVLQFVGTGRLVIAISEGRHSLGVMENIRDMFSEENRQRILHMLGDSLLGITVQQLLPRVGGGRELVTEVLRATHPIKSLIRENKLSQLPNVIQTSRLDGMRNMDQALAEAVKAGAIGLRDAQSHAVDLNQFNLLVSH